MTPRRLTTKRVGGGALLVAIAVSLIGCTNSTLGGGQNGNGSGAASGAQPQFENGNAVLSEYQKTIHDFPLPLPKGDKFPQSPPKSYLQGESQVGVGLGPAYFYWLCSWEAEYLTADSANQSKLSAQALDQIAKWPTTTFARSYVEDPDNQWYKAVVDPAKLGDPSGVNEDMQGEGCAALGVPTP
jgi:hypothetical protein